MNCHNCGTELTDGAAFCGICGAEQPAAEIPQPSEIPEQSTMPPKKKRKHHVGLIVFACIAAVLAAIVIAGFCTNWFGFYGPATRIALAAKNTAEKGNFTIKISTATKTKNTSSYSAMGSDTYVQVDIDPENRELMLYSKSQQVMYGQPFNIYVGIIDGYLISGYTMNSVSNFSKQDIQDDLDELFDAYEDPEDIDWNELFEMIEESTKVALGDILDADEMDQCVHTYFRKLNSNQWLKKNAGYSTFKDGGMRCYKFEPDLYDFSKASLECFEKAFQDTDDYDKVMDGLKDSQTQISEMDTEILIGIESNQLKQLSLKFDSDAIKIDCDMEFRDIGTTEIPEYLLEDLLLKAG